MTEAGKRFGTFSGWGAAAVAILVSFGPIVGVAFAVAFLGERVTAMTLAGGALILVGVAVAMRKGRCER